MPATNPYMVKKKCAFTVCASIEFAPPITSNPITWCWSQSNAVPLVCAGVTSRETSITDCINTSITFTSKCLVYSTYVWKNYNIHVFMYNLKTHTHTIFTFKYNFLFLNYSISILNICNAHQALCLFQCFCAVQIYIMGGII